MKTIKITYSSEDKDFNLETVGFSEGELLVVLEDARVRVSSRIAAKLKEKHTSTVIPENLVKPHMLA